MTDDEDKLLQYLSTPEGKRKLSEAMHEALRERYGPDHEEMDGYPFRRFSRSGDLLVAEYGAFGDYPMRHRIVGDVPYGAQLPAFWKLPERTVEEARQRILEREPSHLADTFRPLMRQRWDVPRPYRGEPDYEARVDYTVEERRQAVLGFVQVRLGLLIPEHEDRAREIYGLLEWPPDFGSVPAFEVCVRGT